MEPGEDCEPSVDLGWCFSTIAHPMIPPPPKRGQAKASPRKSLKSKPMVQPIAPGLINR